METKNNPQGNTFQEVPASQSDKKEKMEQTYTEVFLTCKELKTRQSVYISKEMHVAVTRLIHMFALDGIEISIGAFIDNILAEHMDTFKEHINIKCRKQLEKLM